MVQGYVLSLYGVIWDMQIVASGKGSVEKAEFAYLALSFITEMHIQLLTEVLIPLISPTAGRTLPCNFIGSEWPALSVAAT